MSGAGGGQGGLPPHQSSPPPSGVPMYAVHGDGYAAVPVQHTYALNGDAYAPGVVSHLPPHTHGIGQMQQHGAHGAGGIEGSGGGGGGGPMGAGDQQLVAPHMSALGSSPHPSLTGAPQQMYMSAQGTYVVAGGNGGGSNRLGSSAGGSEGTGGASGAGGSGGGGGGGGHHQAGGGGIQPMMVYQGGSGAPPPQQHQHNQGQGQQQPHGAEQPHGAVSTTAAAAAASQMYLPVSQAAAAGYGYIPQITQMAGVPVYQMAGPGVDGGQAGGRPNGVAGGGGSAGNGINGGGSGRGSPGGSSSITSTPSTAPPHQPPPPPQGFQVHYAITPQGIVPMVPMMPNGAGGFTNPAALYPNLGGIYDDGRGGLGAIPPPAAIAGGNIDGGGPTSGLEKGRLSPALSAGPAGMNPRFAGAPPQPQQSHVQHAGSGYAPGWSVGGAGVHDSGGPVGYTDVGGGFNDGPGGVYRGGAAVQDGYRGTGVGGGSGNGRDLMNMNMNRMPRESDAGKDVKDRRKRYAVCVNFVLSSCLF